MSLDVRPEVYANKPLIIVIAIIVNVAFLYTIPKSLPIGLFFLFLSCLFDYALLKMLSSKKRNTHTEGRNEE